LWASRESIPQGLKPLFLMPLEGAKPKGLAYLEAKKGKMLNSRACLNKIHEYKSMGQ
jgi:hypothetical protein